MGYDLHITRAEHWAENKGQEITAEEWLQYVKEDPELRLAGYNGPYFTIWKRSPDDAEAWLDWFDGDIYTKHPDDPLIQKMVQIATRLGAKVQGDDGETYAGNDD